MDVADDIEDLSYSVTDCESTFLAAKAEWEMWGYIALFPHVMYEIIHAC